MSVTEAASTARAATRIGRSVWIWPVAAAALAAWPVWRSFFSEVPDIGSAPLRGQVLAGVAELALLGLWVARHRGRVTGFMLPLLAVGFAALVLIMAGAHGDALTVDLAALAICWLAVVFLFAGAVLLDAQRAFAARLGGAVPPVAMLVHAHERIGYWLLGIALVGMALLELSPQSYLLAALAAVSPGAVLIWAALCDTARSVLARRRVYVADPSALFALTEHKALLFGDPGMLIAVRPKVISIMPVAESKPAEIVGIAAALLAEDDSDAALGLQDFGVAHRLRLPPVKALEAGAPSLHRGQLPDRSVVEIGPVASLSEAVRQPFVEQLARAEELHRQVLALTEIEPTPRLLGLLVLAKAARPGAAETVRTLRKAGFALALGSGRCRTARPRAAERLGAGRRGGFARRGDRPGAARATAARVVRDDDSLRRPRQSRARSRIARSWSRATTRAPSSICCSSRAISGCARGSPIIAANLPGIALLAAALGHLPATPLVVSAVALAGVVLGAGLPQALRLSPTLANEVDEE